MRFVFPFIFTLFFGCNPLYAAPSAPTFLCKPEGEANAKRLQTFLDSTPIMAYYLAAQTFSYDKATGILTVLTETGIADMCEEHADVTYCATFAHYGRFELNNQNVALITPIEPGLVSIGNIALKCDRK